MLRSWPVALLLALRLLELSEAHKGEEEEKEEKIIKAGGAAAHRSEPPTPSAEKLSES